MRSIIPLSVALATSLVSAQQSLQPKEGEVFPEIAFPTLAGEQASLAKFRGKKVLLMQFASW